MTTTLPTPFVEVHHQLQIKLKMEFQTELDAMINAFSLLSLKNDEAPMETNFKHDVVSFNDEVLGTAMLDKPAKKQKLKRICSAQNKGRVNFQLVVWSNDLLKDITGIKIGSRADFTKRVWAYAKMKSLQDKHDGRLIHPDQKLALLVGTNEKFDGFKLISKAVEKNLKK